MRHTIKLKLLFMLLAAGINFSAAYAGVQDVQAADIFPAGSQTASGEKRLYIVQLNDPPAVAMHGSRTPQGQHLNLPGTGRERFDPEAEHVRRYISRLQAIQNELLLEQNLWNDHVYSYGYTFNGIAVRMTAAEADRLRLRRGVTRVWEDVRRSVATSDSPAFLGLLDAQGGLRTDLKLTGEDVIIGVIDTGITPGHPSFSDRTQPPRAPRLCRSSWIEGTLLGLWLCRRHNEQGEIFYSAPPSHWRGICQTGPGFESTDCNNKVIGARFYRAGFDSIYANPDPNDFASPADADGHGTHVASIAAGNEVAASIFGKSVGTISGMAPRARIAVYKACWLEDGLSRASCSVADLAMAIEDAVADGVDIINYSIGDPNGSLDDLDDLELLAAAEAGVLSVVSAGNKEASKGASTIESPATTPWVISVGATSRAGTRVAEAIRINQPESLANFYESKEAGITPPLATLGPLTAQLVLANDGSTVVPDPEVKTGSIFDACTPLENTADIRGNIALIQRGYCNFDQKIAIADSAGAIAVVIFSNDMDLLVMTGDPSLVNIPAVMIEQASGQLLRDALLAGEAIEITLDKSLFVSFEDDGNVMGTFSGRGPSPGDTDFLKPDLVAPGTAILGGQTPDVANGFRGESFQYLTGTSQAAPHVAGIAALIMQAHPDWGPAEIKSALMTTSRQNIRKENNLGPANPFDMGAGHIVPNDAINPGLVYPVDARDYNAYLCSVGLGLEWLTEEDCQTFEDTGYTETARNINLPSVAISELAGQVNITRRVTNTGPAAQFNIETNVPEGITLDVTPASISLQSGESAEFTLSFTSDGTGLKQWFHGNFSWVNSTHHVYSPFVVQPSEFSFPEFGFGTSSSNSLSIPVGIGYSGTYLAQVNGLFLPCILPAVIEADKTCTNTGAASVADDLENQYSPRQTPPAGVTRFTIKTEDTDNELLRIALFSADQLTDGDADLDLYLYYCEQEPCIIFDQVPYVSATFGTSDELIDIRKPLSGTWVIDVHGYDTADGNPAEFRLYVWSFGSDKASGNLALTNIPSAAQPGVTTDIKASWSTLSEGLWLGGVAHYGNNDAPLGFTVIEVDNNAFPE